MGLQVTVALQVITGLQSPTPWEPFVAATILPSPEHTKERVEPTILSTTAIEIRQMTRFALLFLQRNQCYMWRNHVATWANISGRNFHWNKIRFSRLHYILQYSIWIGFGSEKVESLYWHLEKAQSHSMRPTAMITIFKYYILNHDKVSVNILCPDDPSVKAKSQVSLYASWGNLILKMQHIATRQAKQKISTNLDHHWSKKCSFLCVQTNRACPSGIERFSKNDSDSSLEPLTVNRVVSSHSVKNVTRIESPFFLTWLESSPSH